MAGLTIFHFFLALNFPVVDNRILAGGVQPAAIKGTVNFFDLGKLIGSSPIIGGTAVLLTTSLAAGNHSITAAFPGNQIFTPSDTSATPLSLVVNSGSVGWHNVRTGDFAGDGKTDIAGMMASGQWWVAVSTGSGFVDQQWGMWSTGATWVDVQTGDFNGDGKTDIAGRDAQSGQWWVALSTGSSFTNSLWTTWSTNPLVTWADVKVRDFNGDGKSDIVGRWLQGGQW